MCQMVREFSVPNSIFKNCTPPPFTSMAPCRDWFSPKALVRFHAFVMTWRPQVGTISAIIHETLPGGLTRGAEKPDLSGHDALSKQLSLSLPGDLRQAIQRRFGQVFRPVCPEDFPGLLGHDFSRTLSALRLPYFNIVLIEEFRLPLFFPVESKRVLLGEEVASRPGPLRPLRPPQPFR